MSSLVLTKTERCVYTVYGASLVNFYDHFIEAQCDLLQLSSTTTRRFNEYLDICAAIMRALVYRYWFVCYVYSVYMSW